MCRRIERSVAILVLFLGAVVMACDPPTMPLPSEAIAFVPPASYRVHWRVTEFCSGLSGSYDRLRWYRTSGSASTGGPYADGTYYPDGHRIVLSESALEDGSVIRHEMLHALQPTIERHTPNFMVACRGVVSCNGDCVAKAGGRGLQPGPGSRALWPDSLEVSTIVLAPRPGDSSFAAVMISARNPRDEAIWIDLAGLHFRQFICRIGISPCGRAYMYGSDSAAFAPREKRSEVHVIHTPPGVYTFNTFFNTHAAAPVTLIVP